MKRPLAIASGILGAIWIGATGVLLFYIANLAPVQALLLAFVAMDAAFVLLLAICLVTNTRRAWPFDPYAAPADDQPRPAVMVGDRPYGRRVHDDRSVVERLSDILEDEADKRKPGETPAWVIGVHKAHEPMEEETDA